MVSRYELEGIVRWLNKNEIYPNYAERDDDIVIVQIDGDWKHDHLRCDYVMAQKGYGKIAEDVTDEDGSDWYGSKHCYKRQW